MLVLSRKNGETIRVGEAVLQILSVNGSRVRIGIVAPEATRIVRGELDDHKETGQ